LRANSKKQLVGVVSDTHGLLRPEVLQVFKDVSLILHAGDIGGPEVLDDLRGLAPVIAVRGNNDIGKWARRMPKSKEALVGAVSIYMLHDLKEMRVKPSSDDFQVVVSGHSHRPCVDHREGVLFVNPGSAGPRRFKLPVSVARMIVQGTNVQAELIELL
jgi:hypothetical protein